MTTTRVALFSGNYNYIKDGAALTLNRLVTFLERQGIEVLVFSPTTDTPAMEPSGTLISVPSISIPLRKEYRLALGLDRKTRKILDEFKPTLIHVSAPDLLGHGALSYAQKKNIPAVASFHTRYETYLQYYKLGWLEGTMLGMLRKFYHRCEHLYAPSNCLKQLLEQQDMSDDIRLWSRGIDLKRFSPEKRDLTWRRAQSIQDDDVVVGFAGRLVLEKGLGVFSNVINDLKKRHDNLRVIIAGDGPERERLAEWLPDDTVFAGFLHGDDLAKAYASFDIFLNPSITETFGNVTLEAMASGVVPVCADATGAKSLIDHDYNGFLIDYHDRAGFVDCISELIQKPELRQQISLAARDHAHEYDWENVMSVLLGHYRDLEMTHMTPTQTPPSTRRSNRHLQPQY